MIYTDSLNSITAEQLSGGFFVGWLNPPAPDVHLKLMQGSYKVWLAHDSEKDNQIVGFITAISDGVLTAFIPLLEVLPDYQEQGIGSELVRHMLESLDHLYSVDLLCDAPLQAYYERFGMQRANGMAQRNYDNQNGAGIGD
ncbi:MAG: GNAT family N-acetyltransferase [Chloroflexota bacterium]